MTRRRFLAGTGSGALVLGLSPLAIPADATGTQLPTPPAGAAGAPGPAPPVTDAYPAQDPDLVREMVTVAHFDPDRVRALAERRPALARAAWDWGFGDWESAIGAASHVGNRRIVEILLAHGARPDLFTAAMLGQLEVVRALVTASPGIQRIRGPHGITLLAHARAGGEPALAVARYLEELGDADPRPAARPLADADLTAILGTYRFGAGPRDVLVVATSKEFVEVQRPGGSARRLTHLGDRGFSPAGAEAVRLRFSGESPARTLTVHDGEPALVAERVAPAG